MLNEDVLEAWVGMTARFKNSRLTQGLTYNESIVLFFAYQRYHSQNAAITQKELLTLTQMQKSLLNRTLSSLEEKGLISKRKSESDARIVEIIVNEDAVSAFTEVHLSSLRLIDHIIDIIGEEDARAFVRIYETLKNQEEEK